uniref:Secretory peptide n=1 Tax=Heteropoda venatoria TaxID=152925 RepID=A0A088BPU7_HETVE|nr:secretory peptide [Heteropoda venatoria]
MRLLFIFLLISAFVICSVSSGGGFYFCPRPIDDECPLDHKINDCCAQSECRAGDICCSEPCGNVCRRKSDSPMGIIFKDGTECQLGHVYPKKWYQKAWDKIKSG